MRDIKFRAWDLDEKKMVNLGSILHAWTCEPLTKRELEAFNFMQYTGLKDKNGKEIYEGDILNFPEISKVRHDKTKPNHPSWYGVVTYEVDNDNNFAGFKAGILIYKWSSCEVIGNIYENEELLNG